MKRIVRQALMLAAVAALPLGAQTDRTPDLGATVPGGWTTDRYAPCQFQLANGIHGRNDVLQVGVCAADAQQNRSATYNSTFYNYQGMQTAIDGVGVSTTGKQKISLDLWIDPLWQTDANGKVAASMWSRVNQVSTDDEANAFYPILGFSNASGTGMFRYFNSTTGWKDLSATVNYGAWNTFEIDYTGNAFLAFVNGAVQAKELAPAGTSRLTTAFVESYNFGDTDSPDGGEYVANWSNTPAVTAAPEPASLVLIATGFVGVAAVARRRKARNA